MVMALPAVIGVPETKETMVDEAPRDPTGRAVPPFFNRSLLAEMSETPLGNSIEKLLEVGMFTMGTKERTIGVGV